MDSTVAARRPIVMLASGHPPFDTRIFVKEARTLVHAGYRVSIIIPHQANDEKDNVSLIAAPVMNKGWKRLMFTPWHILKRALRQPRNTIFIIHDSEILITGLMLKIFGRTVVYDAHEDTPLQISYQHWLPPAIRKLYAWMYYGIEKVCGWWFDHILVAEPVIAKYFPAHKTTLIRNFPARESFTSHTSEPYNTRKDILVSIGTLSKVRGLMEIVRSAKLASEKVNFELFLGGKFAPAELQNEIATIYPVNFPGWFSYTAMLDILFQAKAGISIPHPIERYKTNYPVKLFEFMAAGLPVISSKEGESADFVREADAGILVDPLNVQEVAEAIVWIFTHPVEAEAMGKRGQALILKKYNWENEGEELIRVIGTLHAPR